MAIATEQLVQNFILTYLAEHPDFLDVIKKKFSTCFDIADILELVDEETERRIGEALAEHQAGKGILISTPKELIGFLDSIKEEHGIQTGVPA